MYIDQLLTSDQDNTGADLLEHPAPPPSYISAGLHINLIPDASVANAPAGFASEIRQAADIIEANFSDPITLNIRYGWGTYNNQVDPQLTGGNFAEGGDNFQTHQNVAYSTLRSWLTADASSTQDNTALAHLPSTLANSFDVTSAQLRALGHFSGNASDVDGFIGWGTAWTSNFVGGALHELTHAMGRIFQNSSDYIMNLFRYDAPGHFQWTGRQPAYLSIDGGSTRLADFGVSTDFGDFLPGGVQGNDPFNERVSGNNNLTAVDITTMDVIGFNRATGTPPPTTDDFANSLTDGTHPFGVLGATGAATGTLERTGDHDWFRVQLVAGTSYVINLQGQHTGAGTLQDPYLRVYNSTGGFVAEDDDVGGGNLDSRLTFSPTTTGTYYLDAGAFADSYTGTYRISVNGASDDFANSLSDVAHPFGSVSINGSSTGTLETTGDRDWFRVQLVAGTSYMIDLQGQHAGAGTLEDPYLRVHDANGNLLAESDDIVLGINRDSELTFQAGTTGTYYLEAGAFADNYTGTYRLSIAGGSHPPIPAHESDAYRFFDTHDGGHFFTTSTAERDQVLATRPDMHFEGVGYQAFDDTAVAGTSAVYRFFDTHDGGHFFTISSAERDQVIATRPDMHFEGVGYYEFANSQGPNSDPVYRFFDTHDGGHFFTTSSAERDQVIATRPDMNFEGTGFYAPHPGVTFTT
jgi:hypothetical protein